MLFAIGIEYPTTERESYGFVIPALCDEHHHVAGAADTLEQLPYAAKEVIALILEDKAAEGVPLKPFEKQSFIEYRQREEYAHCQEWLWLEFDVQQDAVKRKKINIRLPDYLLRRIDREVAHHHKYKNRSHFLTLAAQNELKL